MTDQPTHHRFYVCPTCHATFDHAGMAWAHSRRCEGVPVSDDAGWERLARAIVEEPPVTARGGTEVAPQAPRATDASAAVPPLP